MPPTRTQDVARQVEKPFYTVMYFIRSGRIPEPARDSAGRFCWSQSDIERLKQAIKAGRRNARRKAVPA